MSSRHFRFFDFLLFLNLKSSIALQRCTKILEVAMRRNTPNVQREGNRINISRLNHPRVASEFLDAILDGIYRGFQEIEISFTDLRGAAFPNACVPIAGLLEYYTQHGIEFTPCAPPTLINQLHIFDPLDICANCDTVLQVPLNKVWNFCNSEEISMLVDAYILEISQQAVCEAGVLDGLTWCINEVMDNVLQHSLVTQGSIMGQIHKINKHIAFCIFDYGQGIYNSLKGTKHAPRTPRDAITLAIREGVTRDPRIGQGNGMWGLHNIVRSNSGTLVITSNSASYMLKGDEINTYSHIPIISRENGMTIIDFQIDYNKGISIADSLKGYVPTNFRIEALEDSHGNICYNLIEKSSGTGTRQSGERIRNEIINIYNETNKIIEIDFHGISVISSSFADELIGKLIVFFGFYGFTQIIKLKNMNPLVQSIVNRSVVQRMAESVNSSE
jgi:hypothetical protein